MACTDCGSSASDKVTTTSRGTLSRCADCGGWTNVTDATGVTISGGINVTGTCAIGPGAVAIGSTGSRKRR